MGIKWLSWPLLASTDGDVQEIPNVLSRIALYLSIELCHNPTAARRGYAQHLKTVNANKLVMHAHFSYKPIMQTSQSSSREATYPFIVSSTLDLPH
jgi:hypothetical protein